MPGGDVEEDGRESEKGREKMRKEMESYKYNILYIFWTLVGNFRTSFSKSDIIWHYSLFRIIF